MTDIITFHIWLCKESVGLCLRICQHASTKVSCFLRRQQTVLNQPQQATVKSLKAQCDKHEVMLKDKCSG